MKIFLNFSTEIDSFDSLECINTLVITWSFENCYIHSFYCTFCYIFLRFWQKLNITNSKVFFHCWSRFVRQRRQDFCDFHNDFDCRLRTFFQAYNGKRLINAREIPIKTKVWWRKCSENIVHIIADYVASPIEVRRFRAVIIQIVIQAVLYQHWKHVNEKLWLIRVHIVEWFSNDFYILI